MSSSKEPEIGFPEMRYDITIKTFKMAKSPAQQFSRVSLGITLAVSLHLQPVYGAEGKAARQTDFEQAVAGAKKDGKVVVAIPPSSELRKQLETVFKTRFGIDVELVPAPGPRNASRIASEHKAGVHYFDALIVGTGTALSLAHEGMIEPLEPHMILPRLKIQRTGGAGIYGKIMSAPSASFIPL